MNEKHPRWQTGILRPSAHFQRGALSIVRGIPGQEPTGVGGFEIHSFLRYDPGALSEGDSCGWGAIPRAPLVSYFARCSTRTMLTLLQARLNTKTNVWAWKFGYLRVLYALQATQSRVLLTLQLVLHSQIPVSCAAVFLHDNRFLSITPSPPPSPFGSLERRTLAFSGWGEVLSPGTAAGDITKRTTHGILLPLVILKRSHAPTGAWLDTTLEWVPNH